ncbi:MAG: Crp/Fnr family transcriptional regulator [Eubacterium sp.]|nr:Crp/Fnr family transcriptional regulator [Eubacterium sp.]
MKKYFKILRECPLFNEIEDAHIETMVGCLQAKPRRILKNTAILTEGEPATQMGILLSGSAQIIREDYYGNRSIVATVEPAQLFGETFACAETKELPVSVVASTDTEVLLMDSHHITHTCCNSCDFHNQMIYNLMKVMAKKNLIFNEKIEITGKRSTKEKLMTYLLMQAKKHHSDTFTIPYNRQELADFLEVERSGLSVEIGKLCKAGIIEADKKTFHILKKEI